MNIYCYRVQGPIDLFCGALTLDVLLATSIGFADDAERRFETKLKLKAFRAAAIKGFQCVDHWGDIREEFWFGIPMECSMEWGLILKQENNGDTFVAAPVELPWLFADNEKGRAVVSHDLRAVDAMVAAELASRRAWMRLGK
jgi:hypothetical protein